MGLFLYGASVGLTWVNLSALSAASGAPDYDPNAQVSSISSGAAGSTVAVKNAVSVDGAREGVLWDLGAVVSAVPGFTTDGTTGLLIRGTMVTPPPDNKQYWQGVALSTSATYATATILGAALKRPTTTTVHTRLGSTSDVLGTATTDLAVVKFMFSGNAEDGFATKWTLTILGGNITESVDWSGPDMTSARLVLVAGCESSTNDGPHSAKILWEAAVVDWSS